MSGYQRSEMSKDQREIVGIFIGHALRRVERYWKVEVLSDGSGLGLVHRSDARRKASLKYVDSFHSLVSVADVERAELKGKQ